MRSLMLSCAVVLTMAGCETVETVGEILPTVDRVVGVIAEDCADLDRTACVENAKKAQAGIAVATATSTILQAAIADLVAVLPSDEDSE